MRSLFVLSFVASLAGAFCGQASAAGFVPYSDAVKACGVDWKASPERAKVEKGHGSQAWNDFRAKCVTDKGYVKGAKAPKA